MTKTAKKVATKKAPASVAVPLSRAELRDKLLGHAPKPERISLTLFGMDLDLVQSTLGSILDMQDMPDGRGRAVYMIIQYACVPGTSERIFESADQEMILNWPFGEDLNKLQEAIADLTGIDISAAMEDMKKDPLKEQS